MDAVSEVKSRISVEDIVSEYVQLKRAGRNFKGLSPFTNEKTPSFVVSPEKQIWHDFSSGKGGDVFSFIEQVEGLDFKAALELLARKAGVDISVYQQGTKSSHASNKERLYDAIDAAVNYYQVQLTKDNTALKYVREKRGYSKQTLIDFRFGFSPKGSANLYNYLKSKGFSNKEMVFAGLCVERRGEVVDMFRERVMIPLSDSQGRPVGFTARQLVNDKKYPKYINTPATVLYDKGRQLFGFSMAKEAIRKAEYVVVVEGNLDVVASHQAGIKQVVASAGTALTVSHLKTLKRFTNDVRLAFDEDRAGQDAAERAIPLAQNQGVELSIIKIPTGKDPDELIKANVDKWRKTVESPEYMVDWLIDRIIASVDISSAPGKRQFTTVVFKTIHQLKDKVEQEHYLRVIADLTKTSVESINNKFNNQTAINPKRLKRISNIDKDEDKNHTDQLLREQHYLSIVYSITDLRKSLEILPIDLFSEQAREFIEQSDNLKKVNKSDEYAKMLALLFEETYQHTEHSELAYQVKQLVVRLVEYYIHNKKMVILKKLEKANEKEERPLLNQVNALERLKKRVLNSTI